jgi:hypothetical protein
VGFAKVHPPPLVRSRSHVSHSRDVTVIRLGLLRQAEIRRSSTCTRLSARASRTALRTVVSDTPARAAMWPTVRVQAPCRRTSADTTARTAFSAVVNRLARAGGKAPDAAHRRRRSRLADV